MVKISWSCELSIILYKSVHVGVFFVPTMTAMIHGFVHCNFNSFLTFMPICLVISLKHLCIYVYHLWKLCFNTCHRKYSKNQWILPMATLTWKSHDTRALRQPSFAMGGRHNNNHVNYDMPVSWHGGGQLCHSSHGLFEEEQNDK